MEGGGTALTRTTHHPLTTHSPLTTQWTSGVEHETITTPAELDDYCRRLARAETIAFDTEFVSEDTYRSHLCLIQVATEGGLAVIDTMAVERLEPFWEVLAEPNHQTIVHAGREEVMFSLHAIGKPPANLFDLQLAAGLVGHEYPAGYGALVFKLTGQRPPKGETRTDWRRRPLSDRQIQYALSDVIHLKPAERLLSRRLTELERTEWMEEETRSWLAELEAWRTRPRWRKVSGISGLSRPALAIVRELWHWRESEAERRNLPPRRVLRDDLLVELAKRGSADPKRISAIRGLERSGAKRSIPELSKAIERGLASGGNDLPVNVRRHAPSQLNLLGQFFLTALTSLCRQNHLAPSIVGTASDVRELVAYRLGLNAPEDESPALAQGWRAEVVGKLIDQLLAGELTVRVDDPLSEHPLVFEPAG